jgi:hypothetical protein
MGHAGRCGAFLTVTEYGIGTTTGASVLPASMFDAYQSKVPLSAL